MLHIYIGCLWLNHNGQSPGKHPINQLFQARQRLGWPSQRLSLKYLIMLMFSMRVKMFNVHKKSGGFTNEKTWPPGGRWVNAFGQSRYKICVFYEFTIIMGGGAIVQFTV